jgi:hypothetical protein
MGAGQMSHTERRLRYDELVAERDRYKKRCQELREGGLKLIEDHSQRTLDALKLRQERDEALDVLRKFAEWNAKYPSSRTYSHYQIIPISKELDEINGEATAILAKHQKVNHEE